MTKFNTSNKNLSIILEVIPCLKYEFIYYTFQLHLWFFMQVTNMIGFEIIKRIIKNKINKIVVEDFHSMKNQGFSCFLIKFFYSMWSNLLDFLMHDLLKILGEILQLEMQRKL